MIRANLLPILQSISWCFRQSTGSLSRSDTPDVGTVYASDRTTSRKPALLSIVSNLGGLFPTTV